MQLATASRPLAHLFTVDVEEYFQVSAFESVVRRDSWDALPSRVEASVDRLLELLARRGDHGTFFVLGWIARRHPGLVRRIHAAGHEIASHGFWHQRVWTQAPAEFRADVRSAKRTLEDVVGAPVYGYRAPSFSIVPGIEWAFEVLRDEGYTYDSSVFPIRRKGYGYPGAPPIPHMVAGGLWEFPLATTTWQGRRVPAAGGGYFRHFPYALTSRAFREHTRDGVPGVFYIHPWELDPEQPRLNVSVLTAVRHYGGLRAVVPRLERLLEEFRFTSIARFAAPHVGAAPLVAGVADLPPVERPLQQLVG